MTAGRDGPQGEDGGERGTILVLDDESAVRTLFGDYLRHADYRVLEAADGRAGLELFGREQPDLVVTDLRMPVMDGLRVLAWIRENSPDTPVIILSGNGEIDFAIKALRLGAWDYLTKPLESLLVLGHAVEKSLERARLIQENRTHHARLEREVAQRTEELAWANGELRRMLDHYAEVQAVLRQQMEAKGRRLWLAGQSDALTKSMLDPLPAASKFDAMVHFATGRLGVEVSRIWVFRRGMDSSGVCSFAQAGAVRTECREGNHCVHLIAHAEREGFTFDGDRQCVPLGHDQTGLFHDPLSDGLVSGDMANDVRFQGREWVRYDPRLVAFAGFRLRNRGGAMVGVMANFAQVALDQEQVADLARLATLASQVVVGERDRETLQEALDQARAASKAKMAFLATMSHEIRTPLNAVVGMTHLLADTELDAQQRTYLDMIVRGSGLLLSVINDILDFSKIEAGKLSLAQVPIDLGQLVEEVGSTLAPSAFEKGLELACLVAREVPARLLGDAARLKQLLVNLVGNAIKFASAGEVVIRVEVDPDFAGASGFGEVGMVPVHIRVVDTGVGIPEAQREAIFEPFHQVEEFRTSRHGGTGLGLAICRRLSDLMKGRLWIESQVGEGSCFHFFCPMGLPDAGVVEGTLPGRSLDFAGRRVVVADGHAATRESLLAWLVHWGAGAVVGAADLAELRERRGDGEGQAGEILLLDSRMLAGGGPSGGEVSIGHEWGGSSVVLMVPPVRDQLATWGKMERRGCSVLLRPVRRGELHRVLDGLLGGEASGREVSGREERSEAPVVRSPMRILVVEDDRDSREFLVQVLTRGGHEVEVAENGEAALETLRGGGYHLVLMDLALPVLDGLETTRRIRSGREPGIDPTLPVVALTAHVLEEERQACRVVGMNAHLSKPVEVEVLMATVARFVPGARRTAMVLSDESRKRLDRDFVVLSAHPDPPTRERRVVFPKEGERLYEALQQALATKEFAMVERRAQELRRAAGAIGAVRLNHQVMEVIRLARKGEMERVRTAMGGVETELDQVINRLRWGKINIWRRKESQ